MDDGMDGAIEALLGTFREEARELLCDMESALMELESRPDDAELVARAFRALHTIKGNSAMFGLEELERFAHDLEHVFDLLRKGAMPVTPAIVDLALGAKDRLLALLYPAGDSDGERALREADRARIATIVPPAGSHPDGATAATAAAAPPAEPAPVPLVGSPALIEAFKEEARDLLADLEGALLALEDAPADQELVERAFRTLHTIRGNAGMFGFAELEAFAHELESVFEQQRSRGEPVPRELIDLTLEARDRIQHLLCQREDPPGERARRGRDVDAFHRLVNGRPAAGAGCVSRGPSAGASAWQILFRPERGLFAGGTDPLLVFDELRGMGPCSVRARLDAVPQLEEIDPEGCYLTWEIELTTERTRTEILDAFIFVGGDSLVEIAPATRLPSGDAGGTAASSPWASVGTAAASAPGAVAAGAVAAGECGPTRLAGAAPAAAESAAREGLRSAAAAALQRAGESATTLRVGAAKLDKLVDLVGELVTVQARLSRLASLRSDPELLGAAEEVERLTGELRDHSLSVRMVPIGPAFGKFRRLVRDLAHEIGRDVEMTTEGEATELDKSIVDRLGDPIVHLLRNSIDHGIELPEQRARAGKPARGRIRLSASYAGASVVVRVEDDGAGIDAAAVRCKALQRGLIGEGDARSERELHALMFLPGFSTSDTVTNISGRGVGLDVVRRAVENLRGQVRVESRAGAGTAFEIQIPLTLAIIEGLEVVLGGEHLILPLAVVNECVELVRRAGDHGRERSLAEIRGELVPFVRLRDWFRVPGDAPGREQIVVTEAEGRRVGLVVDQVIGGRQTVIKPLGRLFRGVRGLAGATILGDGTVALILDVLQLVQGVESASADRGAHP